MSEGLLDTRLAQKVVISTAMMGIALVFILSGHEPGWQTFAVSGLLALSFLIASFVVPQGSQWVGMLALAVLLMGMFWERDRPLAAVAGIVLTLLNSLSARHSAMLASDDEATPDESSEQSESGMANKESVS